MAHQPLRSPYTGIVGWIDARLPIIRMLDKEYLQFRVPRNLNYFWSFGGILMICPGDPDRDRHRAGDELQAIRSRRIRIGGTDHA